MILKLGEIREIGFEFQNSIEQSFVIDGADYAILNREKEIIESGNAQIDGTKVLTLFNANMEGSFNVDFIVHIGPEIYKPKISIIVRG